MSQYSFMRVLSGSQGAGTDDDVLIEILASRTSEQIKDIIKVYQQGDLLSCKRQKQRQFLYICCTVFLCPDVS